MKNVKRHLFPLSTQDALPARCCPQKNCITPFLNDHVIVQKENLGGKSHLSLCCTSNITYFKRILIIYSSVQKHISVFRPTSHQKGFFDKHKAGKAKHCDKTGTAKNSLLISETSQHTRKLCDVCNLYLQQKPKLIIFVQLLL